jgi:hypothetical protein
MATITEADYTVEMKVKEKPYRAWYETEYLKAGGDHEKEVPPLMSLKKHFINVIEEQLTRDFESENLLSRST